MPKKGRKRSLWWTRRARLNRGRRRRLTTRSHPRVITEGVVCETPLELNFSNPRDLFCSLICPVSEDGFFADYWEKKPLLITRGGGNIPLFTLETLRRMVRDSGPLLFGRHVNISRYASGRRRWYGQPGEELTARQLDTLWTEKKATVQFLQPQHFQDQLWQLLSLLESYFNCLVGSNVYLTPGGSQGLAPHYDDVEVFIIQLEGSKKWKLYPPIYPLPQTPSPDLRPREIGAPSHELTLHVGDVLYFPRGTIHEASTPSSVSHSTHITISTYQQHTWGDLLSDAFSYSLQQLMCTRVDFRKGLPLQLTQAVTKDTKPTPMLQVRDQLQDMGDAVLKHVNSYHATLLKKQKLSFITNRLPPFAPDLAPQGPLPSLGCKVQLKWPDHVVVLNESEMREMEDCGLLPGRLRQRAGKESTEEKRDGEREEEVVLYHSVANDRTSHMVDGERQKEPRGLRFPASGHHELTLSLLMSLSSTPVPTSSLSLSPGEDILPLLLSLWAEGLLLVT